MAAALTLLAVLAAPVGAQSNSPPAAAPAVAAPTEAAARDAVPGDDAAAESVPADAGASSDVTVGGDAGQPADGPSLSLALPHDLSPWAMFIGADAVVKIVMVMLVLASILTWTVWLGKSVELRNARRRLVAAMPGLDEAATLVDAASRTDAVLVAMVAASRKELAHFPAPFSNTVATGIKERVSARLERIEASAGKRMRRGVTVLASIGATAPFVGLFGTVWGIMNSFVGISEAQTTNLAVVAPGIAEALLATALGLVAAIPAVLIYNSFVRGISGYKALVADAATLVMCIVSRELDRQALDGREPIRADAEPRRPVAVK